MKPQKRRCAICKKEEGPGQPPVIPFSKDLQKVFGECYAHMKCFLKWRKRQK